MSWEKAKLGNIIKIQKGKAITKKDSKEGPYPVILGGREPAYYIDQYNHTGKAIVVSRSGASAGYISFWNEAIFVTDGFLVEPRENIDIDYLYYLMKSHESELMGLQGGAAIPHVTPKIIGEINVCIPDISMQRKISDILLKYDDSIKNNRKQIKLLEEVAQRLYKEWFVDLRFPGYENYKIVDGVTDGWTQKKIFDLGEIITGKTPSTSKEQYYGGNIPFVKIPDMHDCVFPITTEVSLTNEGANTQKNKYIPQNGIMVSCIATVGLVNIAIEPCQTNQQINSIILNNEQDLYYVYSSMKRLKELLEGVGSNGATMTNVNKTKFGKLEVVYPNDELRKLYYNYCKPIFEKIYALSRSIKKLSQARDCLLPKLMSGEIEV